MLLAINPSVLARLGISPTDLIDWGTADIHPLGRFVQSQVVKVVSLLSGPVQSSDPNSELLTAESMAERMQCSRANVYEREKKGALFSILPPGRENGRRYPAFQLLAPLDTSLLTKLIARFRAERAPMNLLWDFLRSVQPSLGGVTGVELLLGRIPPRSGVLPTVLDELNRLSVDARQEYVIEHALEGLSYALS
ncbi:hypothetical protein AEP_01607 [Curvibacter sp. AEP1-3]|uniref:hypothetical protein n=1 Tax=Curvibacter sp. AEP1-3 TaxID=1844971 RepID=UPI000B3CC82E|nr:hypothetical protein [Curvibacter sp. AEP1-3]ARV18551.1 hypothetical protein AEP_01607 [Curvibacter sp. AEP1-3]